MAKTIASTHCIYTRRDGQAEWARVAWKNTSLVDLPKVVTNPSTNLAQSSLTLLTWPLCQTRRTIHKWDIFAYIRKSRSISPTGNYLQDKHWTRQVKYWSGNMLGISFSMSPENFSFRIYIIINIRTVCDQQTDYRELWNRLKHTAMTCRFYIPFAATNYLTEQGEGMISQSGFKVTGVQTQTKYRSLSFPPVHTTIQARCSYWCNG